MKQRTTATVHHGAGAELLMPSLLWSCLWSWPDKVECFTGPVPDQKRCLLNQYSRAANEPMRRFYSAL